MSVGRRMTSCFNSHFSCTPNWSKVFETNTSGQQNFCESVFLEGIFMYGTKALAGKGLSPAFDSAQSVRTRQISQSSVATTTRRLNLKYPRLISQAALLLMLAAGERLRLIFPGPGLSKGSPRDKTRSLLFQ